jgi:short-subunit dehydrogenase
MSSKNNMFKTFSVIIVTGGSSGIGKSYIEHAIEGNPDTLICNLSRTPFIAQNRADIVKQITCDLSKGEAIEEAYTILTSLMNVHAKTGRILLINNSGFGSYGLFPQPNLAENLGIIDVNIKGIIHLSGLLLPLMKVRGGSILTVASTAAFQPTPWLATYGASKAFVLNWSLALNEELRGTGVNVLAVCPGPTSTQFFKRAGLSQGSVSPSMSQTSDQVVTESINALIQGKAFIVTGWKNRLLTSLSGFAPRVLVTRIAASMIASYRTNTGKR